MKRYDLIVLGSGSAARDAAAKATQVCGAEVALSKKPPPVRFETVVDVRVERRKATFPAASLDAPPIIVNNSHAPV